MPPPIYAHRSDHFGEPFFMCIASRAEPVISFPRGVYFPRGFGARGGGNLHLSLPARRRIARGEDTRIEFAGRPCLAVSAAPALWQQFP